MSDQLMVTLFIPSDQFDHFRSLLYRDWLVQAGRMSLNVFYTWACVKWSKGFHGSMEIKVGVEGL